jgi:hypothetical protein
MSIGTYGEPDAVSKAVDYANFRSRSHRNAVFIGKMASRVALDHVISIRQRQRKIKQLTDNVRYSRKCRMANP